MATTKKQGAAAKKPPKKKVQKVKGKKNENARNAVPVCGASDCRIWRVFDDAGERWVRWTSSVTGQKRVDSRVHHCGREVGHSNGEDESSLDTHLKAVEERLLRNMSHLKKSGPWRMTNHGNFECYELKAHPTDPHAKFLLEIENPWSGLPRNPFQNPLNGSSSHAFVMCPTKVTR
jgi:hypothetical protein